MKKIICFTVSLFMLFSFFSLSVYAINDYTEILDNADNNTKEYLEKLGVDSESGNGLTDISLINVFKFLFSLVTDNTKRISIYIITVISAIIINSVLSSFTQENESAQKVINYITVLCIVSSVIVPLKDVIINTGVVIKTAAVFSDSYIPIFASLVAASGNIKLAFTYNSFAILFSSFISELADSVFTPVIYMLFAFNVLTSFTFESYNVRIFQSLKRLIVVLLSIVSTVYTGLLTTQSILSVSDDSLTVRGIRFFSGTFIPVVGSGVSESVSSVMSSLSVMRNSVGVLIIILIVLIFLPMIIELLIWYFALQFSSIIADLFGNAEISEILNSISSVISLINIILFYITFVLIISTGIIIVSGK